MEYIKYLKELNYPDYSQNHNGLSSSKTVDLKLLDLSLSEKANITKKLLRIINQSIVDIGKYSFAQDPILVSLISNLYKVNTENIAVTAGCDGGLRLISRILINSHTRVCIPLPSFGRYEFHAKVNQGQIFYLPPQAFPYRFDIKKIVEFCKKKKIDFIFLANPNNPTGIYLDLAEIKYLLDHFKGFVVLDEALIYPGLKGASSLLPSYPNLIIAGSFSKFYGLVGARIGYVFGEASFIKALLKLESPFELNSIAISLAISVLRDKSYPIKEKANLLDAISLLRNLKLKDIEITPTNSFTAILKSDKQGNFQELLLNNNIKTVSGKDFRGLENENCVRIAIRDKSSIKKLIGVLTKISKRA